MSRRSASELGPWFAFLLLLTPLIVVLSRVHSFDLVDWRQLGPVLYRTMAQAALSGVSSLVAGAAAAMGLLWWRARFSSRAPGLVAMLLALPAFLPTFVIVLAMFRFAPGVRGVFGIAVAHALMNAGLIGVSIEAIARARIGGMAELAYVEGATTGAFMVVAARYLRRDLFMLFSFVFALSFTSLAVPLLLGGSEATTLELLIFQKLHIYRSFDEAAALAVLQIVFLVAVLSLWPRPAAGAVASREVSVPLLHSPLGLLVGLLPLMLCLSALLSGLSNGWRELWQLGLSLTDWIGYALGSLVIGMFAGFFSLLFFLLLLWVPPQKLVRRLLLGYVAPSATITGFGLLLMWRGGGEASLIKIAIAVTLACLPSLYRLQWDGAFEALVGQRETAWLLGAGRTQIFTELMLPQLWRTACQGAALAAVWAWSDIALSAVLAEGNLTLSMLAQRLMSSYRLDAASVVMCMVVLGSGLCYAVFWSLGNVFGRRTTA